MRTRTLILSAASLAAACTLALSACGGTGASSSAALGAAEQSLVASSAADAPSVAQAPAGAPAAREAAEAPEWSAIQPELVASLKKASSLSVTGSTGTGAQKMETSARGTTAQDGDFEITMKQTSTDMEFTILRVAGLSYMKGTEEAFSQMMGDTSGEAAQLLGNKYLILGESMLEGMGSDMNVAGLRDELVSMTPAADAELVGQPDEYAGQPSYSYSSGDLVVHVTRDAEPRPLAYLNAQENDVYVLEAFDADLQLAAPKDGDVVDLESLAASGS